MKVRECRCCHRVRPHEARGLCHTCYRRAQDRGTLADWPLIGVPATGRKVVCARCGRLRWHMARELCGQCHNHCYRNDTLADYPRKIRLPEEVLADFDILRGRGLCKQDIADRLGMTLVALNRCLCRHRGTQRLDRQPPITAGYLETLGPVEDPESEEDAEAAGGLLNDLLFELDDAERYRFRRWAAKAANGLQFRPDECDALAPGATIDGTPYLDAPVRDAVRSL